MKRVEVVIAAIVSSTCMNNRGDKCAVVAKGGSAGDVHPESYKARKEIAATKHVIESQAKTPRGG